MARIKKRSDFYWTLGAIGVCSSIAQWVMLRHATNLLQPYWTVVIFLLLPLLYVLPNTHEKDLPLWLVRILSWLGGYWFIFSFYATMLFVPFVVLWVASLFLPPEVGERFLFEYSAAAWIFLIVLELYGAWKAVHPIVRPITIETEKLHQPELRLAFASDIHLGILLGPWFARWLVRDMNRLQPDYILFGGDIIDGNLHVVEKSRTFDEFRHLQPRFGTYTAIGNHDNYSQRVPDERRQLDYLGMHTMEDEQVKVPGNLTIACIGDALYHPDSHVPELPKETFNIVIDHEPLRMQEAAQNGADLYLAGHTHAGQFFPIRHFTKKIFDLDFGNKMYGKMLATVTSGYGAWGALFRLGPSPEIVLITLKHKGPFSV